MMALARAWGALVVCVGLLGCDGVAPAPDGGSDAGAADAYVPADSGELAECETDEDCDDGVSCTVDSCGPTGLCRNAVDATLCDDGIFCNGVERCDPTAGCAPPSIRETCNDDDVCTIDRCDEETRSCVRTPRDLDGDGDADWFCEGGGDCDDSNANISSLLNEVCLDSVDNDCDAEVDEADCGRPRYDTCDEPLDVSEGGFFLLNTVGAGADHPLSCAFAGNRDLVATFTLTEARSVDLVAEGEFFTVALSLRTSCASSPSELACRSGYPGRLQRRSLAAGTYYVVVAGSSDGEIGLTVRFGEPLPAPANEACAAPIDVSSGGTYTASFVEVRDDVALGCGPGGAPDLVYTFTTEETRDLVVTAQSPTGEALAWAVRSTCDRGPDVRCFYGSPASGRVYGLPAGTYYLVVEGPTYVSPDLRLSVELLAPEPPPPGDTCADPVPLTLGATYTGTLADKQNDHSLTCGVNDRDAVHVITLEETSDLRIELNAGSYASVNLTSVCGAAPTELGCSSGSPTTLSARGVAPGTYYVLVESWRASGYTLRVSSSAPTTPSEVSGNEDCATAHEVPATGGLFRGNTASMTDDYGTSMCGGGAVGPDAVYRLTLASSKRVVASTAGTPFDTVLHMHRDVCVDRAEFTCNDDADGATTSTIDRILEPGTWFIIMDGYGAAASGAYSLEVTVTDP